MMNLDKLELLLDSARQLGTLIIFVRAIHDLTYVRQFMRNSSESKALTGKSSLIHGMRTIGAM